MNYYVWYRVAADDAETETLVRGMMARVACQSGVPGRLLKKRDEPRLWMEVYEAVADTVAEMARFERILAEKTEAYDLDMRIDGARRIEAFAPFADTAPACAP